MRTYREVVIGAGILFLADGLLRVNGNILAKDEWSCYLHNTCKRHRNLSRFWAGKALF